jgi:ABC-type amino acid transport substrate-binding protein
VDSLFFSADYLAQHPVIKIANDPNWEPFEFIDENGQLQGISADYIRLFEQQLGVKFESIPNKKWHDLLDTVKSGERPVVIARHATDERKQYMSFTKPYLFFPLSLLPKKVKITSIRQNSSTVKSLLA